LRWYSLAKKLHSQTVIREKQHKALSYEKGASKMMMKLIPAHVTTFGRPTCHIKICQKNVLFVLKNVLFVLKKCSFCYQKMIFLLPKSDVFVTKKWSFCYQKMFFLLPKTDLFVLKIINIKYIQNIHFFLFSPDLFQGEILFDGKSNCRG